MESPGQSPAEDHDSQPHDGQPFVQLRETHVATVFLIGDRAYKLKKPVDVGFLDFTSRESRHAVCHREVELNRRMAPDVYLGVADVIGPDGQPCDHLVVMRRMPDDRRLANLVRHGADLGDQVTKLARQVAAFHASADRGHDISEQGTRNALRARWTASFEQVRALPTHAITPELIDSIERAVLDFLAGREPLFDARIRAGRIVDGHGDLLADDVFCLDDGPRVLDCLEFDDRLRWLDGLDDIAFLVMDLERLGADRLATELLARYAEFADDPAPPALCHHYLAYRAFVRAKVACFRQVQGDPTAAASATAHAELALRHLRAGTVRLILVGGLPATGKSTISGRLADRMETVLLSSDRLRKELAGLSPQDSAAAEYQQGIYTQDQTDRTYQELLRRAETLLSHGESVIIDASWTNAKHRDLAAEVAASTTSELVSLRCCAPTEVTAARLRAREHSTSDADARIAEQMATDAAPWPEAYPVTTTQSVEDATTEAMNLITGRLSTSTRTPVPR
jgi:aminoglycoside phosphotransferase family enzyme/predicted kinase